MKAVEFEDGVVAVDAAISADGLGLALPELRKQMLRTREKHRKLQFQSGAEHPTTMGDCASEVGCRRTIPE